MYKVIKPFKGSPDGFTVIEYAEGEIADIEGSLAQVVLDEGWAELIDPIDEPEQLDDEDQLDELDEH